MARLDVREIADGEEPSVAALWERCGLTNPWDDPPTDIAFARSSGNATILVAHIDGALAASAMVGHDGHRGTVYYVSVDPDHWREGLGRAVMEATEEWLRAHGVLKLNLLVRTGNEDVLAFYKSIGYAIEERVNMTKWLDPSMRPETE